MVLLLTLARRFWWAVPMLMLVALVHVRTGQRDAGLASVARTTAVLDTSRLRIDAAMARAVANAVRAKAATETRYATIEREQDEVIELARADARRAVDDHVRLHRAPATDRGGSRATDLPDLAGAAGGADAAAGGAVVSAADLAASADAWVVADGWQRWWRAVSGAGDAGSDAGSDAK